MLAGTCVSLGYCRRNTGLNQRDRMVLKVSTITISPFSVRPILSRSFCHLPPVTDLPARVVFGSAQLRGHKYLRPKAIHDDEILEEFSKDYMYLSYVRYINSVRTSSSPLLFFPSLTAILPFADQDRLSSLALANARRHLRCQNLGQGEPRHGKDVQSRSSRQAPRRTTLPLRFPPPLPRLARTRRPPPRAE
jgi:hypothetical protein